MEWASIPVSVHTSRLAYKCRATLAAPDTLLVSGTIVGAFVSLFSPHSRRTLNHSSLAPASNLYLRLHCLKLVLLVSPSGTTFLPISELES